MRLSAVAGIATQALSRFWGVVLLLGLWELWVLTATPNPLVVVPPAAVLGDMAADPFVYCRAAAWTLSTALAGLAMGMLIGLLLAVLAWGSKLLSGAIAPAAILISSTPVVCIIPLLARIFGYGIRAEFVTVSIMMFFPSFVFAASGLKSTPELSTALADTWNTPLHRRLWLIAFPAAMPSLATALRAGAAASILVTVVSEYLMQTGGLGALFATTMQRFDIARALGASAVVMLLSSILYSVAGKLEQRIRLRFT